MPAAFVSSMNSSVAPPLCINLLPVRTDISCSYECTYLSYHTTVDRERYIYVMLYSEVHSCTPAVSASAALLMISALPISAAANSTRNSSSIFMQPSRARLPKLQRCSCGMPALHSRTHNQRLPKQRTTQQYLNGTNTSRGAPDTRAPSTDPTDAG